MKKSLLSILTFLPLIVVSQVQVTTIHKGSIEDIMLPKGYRIEIYASGIATAREMDFAEDSTLFVGSSDAGKVYAIRPDRSVIIIDDNLDKPAGLDYYNGDLYVAESSRILKYENILKTMGSAPKPVILNQSFPVDTVNELKFIRIGPDGKLYIQVGASCNACIPDTVWHARILRMSLDGGEIEYYAEGVRNAGGFDWNPETLIFWFDEDGRDDLGYNTPSDELNKVLIAGKHFGFPYIDGKVTDREFWPERPKSMAFTTPVYILPAHSVPLGIRFYKGKMFDKKYREGIFIAEHGSLSQAAQAGCRISFVTIRNDRPLDYEVFAAGWQQGTTTWGRPADVQAGPDGSLFISDDLKGCIYRIYK
jgi:glucose/arabinose dehydrogenase